MPQTMDAPGAQAATEGVQGQLAIQLNTTVLNEIQGLSLLTETVGLQAVDDRGGEAVVDLGHVNILGGETGALPGEAGGAAAALHIATQAADAPSHLEGEPLTVAGDIRRARFQIAGPLGGRQDDRN